MGRNMNRLPTAKNLTLGFFIVLTGIFIKKIHHVIK